MLNANTFDEDAFEALLKTLDAQFDIRLRFYDFVTYNLDVLHQARVLKTQLIESEHYEEAAKQREIEVECEQHVKLKDKYNIEKSIFYLDRNLLFFFYIGKSKNDKEAKLCFRKLISQIGKQKDITYLPFIPEEE